MVLILFLWLHSWRQCKHFQKKLFGAKGLKIVSIIIYQNLGCVQFDFKNLPCTQPCYLFERFQNRNHYRRKFVLTPPGQQSLNGRHLSSPAKIAGAHNTETDIVVTIIRIVPVTGSTTQILCIIVERPATHGASVLASPLFNLTFFLLTFNPTAQHFAHLI